MRPLPSLSVRRCGVFTRAEALAAGWTVDALRHAVRAGALERVRAGCFAPPRGSELNRFAAADLRLAREAVAATLVVRGAAVSHLAAAHVMGLPFWAESSRACVTTPGTHTHVAGVHAHRSAVHDGHLGTTGGVAVTSPERTVADVAREFGVESALVVGDAALRRGLIDRRELDEVIATLGRRSDVSAARLAADMLDPRAESPLESRSRWQLSEHGIDAPQTQVHILTPDGVLVGRTDFYWGAGVVGEVDGSMKYTTDLDGENVVLGAEKWRQEHLERLELEVVRWGSRDLRDFAATAARIRRALARAANRDGEPPWIAVPHGTTWQPPGRGALDP
ncbi:type IV toxin-antitoxin system AbiEi family antitoxin domain-containing protein [Jatrophihabitans sp. YIM 134969]